MGSNSGDSQSGERSIRLKNLEIERKRLEIENEEKRKRLLELQKRELLIKKAAENGGTVQSLGVAHNNFPFLIRYQTKELKINRSKYSRIV